MKYAVVFLCLSLVLMMCAFWFPAWSFLLAWYALSFGWFGLAYANRAPGMLGKDSRGKVVWWVRLLLWPCFVLNTIIWQIHRVVHKEPAYQQLLPKVWIGRKLLASEYPEQIEVVLHLTAEFGVPQQVAESKEVFCLPILDTSVPDARKLIACFERLRFDKCLYIHCAQGHGRTGTVASSLLLWFGEEHDAEEAIRRVQQVRPGVRLHTEQRRFVEAFGSQI